jgi:hypothetical protein
LFEIMLRQKRDEISQAEVLRELETLSVTWRGDAIEVKTLQMMARIYADAGRYGEAFAAARPAPGCNPIQNHRGRRRTWRRRCSRSFFSAREAMIFRRSMRSGCFTNIAN